MGLRLLAFRDVGYKNDGFESRRHTFILSGGESCGGVGENSREVEEEPAGLREVSAGK